MKRSITIGAIIASSLGAAAFAHTGATGVVLERMKGMSAMKKAMGELAPMMRGEVPYNVATVQKGAETIMAHAGGDMVKLFPEEAIPATSYAVPALWEQWQEFSDLADLLESQAFGLDMAASTGLTAPQPDMPSHDMAAMNGMDTMAGTIAPPSQNLTVAQLMGVEPTAVTGQSASALSEERDSGVIDYATISASAAFEMVSQTCAACHTQFRRGN
ncbi:c-type cytochrome [Loktanella sp. DJP18]|uniref:c-type cytochrome n=1 Tax=Loktanella sp. DJP18 TaxID=3409788 RepID=UPI003BB4BFE0